MAIEVTGYECWLEDLEAATSPRQKQYMKFTCTAANTDTDWDFGDAGGNLWASAATTSGAAAQKICAQIQSKAEFFAGILGDLHMKYDREVAASAADYIIGAGTSWDNIPNLTFASGSAPTAIDIVFCWILGKGQTGITASGTD